MSQFFDYRAASSSSGQDTLCQAWSSKEPVLAVSSNDCAINFYQEEGQRAADPVVRQCAATALAWQPGTDLLASGWQDGTIQVVSLSSLQPKEDQVVHSAAIHFVKWNKDGSRLVTGDRSGCVGVWKSERGRLIPIIQYTKVGAITHCVFCPPAEPAVDDGGKAAPAITSFFFGGEAGQVCYADDMGNCSMVLDNLHSSINVMEFFEEKSRLVIITKSLSMTQLQVSDDGMLKQVQRYKLSMKAEQGIQQAEWVGPGLLATSSPEESLIRVWDLADDNNFTISLSSGDSSIPRSDRVTAIAFNPRKSVLAAGTAEGRVVMWRHYHSSGNSDADGAGAGAGVGAGAGAGVGAGVGGGEDAEGVSRWDGIHSLSMGKQVQDLSWGPGDALLGALLFDDAAVLRETVLRRKLAAGLAVMQLSTNQLAVERIEDGNVLTVKVGLNIKGMDTTGKHTVVWNGKKVEVYENQVAGIRLVSSFDTRACSIAIHKELLYCAQGSHIAVCKLSGTVTQKISFTDSEGDPILLNHNSKFLAVATSKGRIKVLDVARVQPRQVGSAGIFQHSETKEAYGEISSIACNCDGTRVSLLASRNLTGALAVPDNRVFVYSLDMDQVFEYDCGSTRYPRSHYWDSREPKLLAVETFKVHGSANGGDASAEEEKAAAAKDGKKRKSGVEEDANVEVITMFATPSGKVIMQDCIGLESSLEALLALQVPHLYFVAKVDASDTTAKRLQSRPLRDFVGLDKVDDQTRQALVDFSFHLSTGNMDEAYKAVKLIENPSVWENMAHMCVKSKRLDVAEVCLGNMGHARGARAVRESKKEQEHDARVAMVAIQLGLIPDAVKLYKGCGRYDLLNNLYQASGHWERALAVAAKVDRIHLKTTHYLYAKHLEAMGDTAQAIQNYELAEAHRYEVPRMLSDANQLDELAAYISAQDDPELLKWWAQFCESKGDFNEAVKFYGRANDVLSLVRVYCYNNDFAAASEMVIESNDSAAAYHLARQHESQGNMREAIQFFERAGRFNHAVRLAKEQGFDNELMNMALQSSKETMLDVAHYFDERQAYDKAVQLYQKGGNIPRALDLCFRANLFDDLRVIADDLGEETPPEVLTRCSEFFIDHGQFAKAVHLQITAKRFNDALDLCMAHKIIITDEMAEKMTPPKPPKTETRAVAERTELLLKLAKCCKKQGSFHLATKKYTQAGDKMKAMKALLKSGDTEKIIFFAGVSRTRDIYILAANYLQILDWRNDQDIVKAVIQFYSKARAFDQLAGFYDAAAQSEIDDFRNYEKALGALKDAAKYMAKSRSAEKDRMLDSLNQRIGMVDRFVTARKLIKSDPAEMVKICQGLLEAPEMDASVRVGDVFALLIEFYYANRDMEQAYNLVENMRDRNIILGPYLDHEMVRKIYEGVGMAPPDGGNGDDDDEIGEELDEEVVESDGD